jgi:hypothetical protein
MKYNDYKYQFCVHAKQGYYGGRMFVKWNTRTKKYVTGNSASTAVSDSGIVDIEGVTNKELKHLVRGLRNAGYKEHEIKWNQKVDTYESIHKAGL